MPEIATVLEELPTAGGAVPANNSPHNPEAGGEDDFAHLEGYVEEARSRTEIAESFDIGHVLARYRREQGFSEAIANDHRRELMRFLALSATALNHGRFYGMMGAIDELWHTFVIFTREYAEFCDKVAGRFLHHVPEVEGGSSTATFDNYLAFLADYQKIYGERPAPGYWPNPDRAKVRADNACRGCGGCGSCGSGGSCTVH
jgi:hypothetical protein